jgi:ankyrin repeat protein
VPTSTLKNGSTALCKTSGDNHEAVFKLLLKNGAEVNPKNGFRYPVLCHPSLHGHESVVKLLLQIDANINTKNKQGRTALYWAAIMAREAVI